MPNRRFVASVVENSVLVRKFTWSAASDGIACTSRNTAIRTMDTTISQARRGGEPLEHGVTDAPLRGQPRIAPTWQTSTMAGRLPVRPGPRPRRR